MDKKVSGIILIAGNSTRYGKKSNKNFELLNGIPIVQYSINIFNENENIDEIILVIREEDRNEIEKILEFIEKGKEIRLVKGGITRQESVYNALKESKGDIVLIHDGARPLLQHQFIKDLLDQMNVYLGASVGVKSKDTIKITNEIGEVLETTNRANTWLVQTPQCFDKKSLLEAHEKEKGNPNITDDCMLLELQDTTIIMLEGDYKNIKVTTRGDIDILEEFLRKGE